MTLKIINVQNVLCKQYRVNNFCIGYSPLAPCRSPLYGSLQIFTGLAYIYPDKYWLLVTSGCTAYIWSWLQNILVRGCLYLEIFCILNRIGTRELYTILTKSSRVQQDQMEMNKYTVQKAIGYHPMLLVSVVTIFSDWLSPFLHLSLLK